MVLDSEQQRLILTQALTNVQVQGNYSTLCEVFPALQNAVEAVKAATVVEKACSCTTGEHAEGCPYHRSGPS